MRGGGGAYGFAPSEGCRHVPAAPLVDALYFRDRVGRRLRVGSGKAREEKTDVRQEAHRKDGGNAPVEAPLVVEKSEESDEAEPDATCGVQVLSRPEKEHDRGSRPRGAREDAPGAAVLSYGEQGLTENRTWRASRRSGMRRSGIRRPPPERCKGSAGRDPFTDPFVASQDLLGLSLHARSSLSLSRG